MHLYVIRHAQSTMNIQQGGGPNCNLSELGQWQAAQIPQFFENVPVKAIFCSPLRRVIQTAKPLAKSKGLPIVLIPEMSEIFNEEWGDYRDYSWESCEQVLAEYPETQFISRQDHSLKWWPTWPEKHADVRKRVQRFVDMELQEFLGTEEHIVVFGHGQSTADLKQIANPGDTYPVYNAGIVDFVLNKEGKCESVELYTGHLGEHVFD